MTALDAMKDRQEPTSVGTVTAIDSVIAEKLYSPRELLCYGIEIYSG